MSKSKTIGLVILLGVLAIASWRLISLSNELTDDTTAQIAPPEQASQEQITTSSAVIIIDDGALGPTSFEMSITSTTTAFDLLARATKKASLELEAKEYDEMGIFIEAIGEQKNGQNNKYWLYYINNEMPMTSSDKYLVQPNDNLLFRFEESTF